MLANLPKLQTCVYMFLEWNWHTFLSDIYLDAGSYGIARLKLSFTCFAFSIFPFSIMDAEYFYVLTCNFLILHIGCHGWAMHARLVQPAKFISG
jgi:hypothetical protein